MRVTPVSIRVGFHTPHPETQALCAYSAIRQQPRYLFFERDLLSWNTGGFFINNTGEVTLQHAASILLQKDDCRTEPNHYNTLARVVVMTTHPVSVGILWSQYNQEPVPKTCRYLENRPKIIPSSSRTGRNFILTYIFALAASQFTLLTGLFV